MRSAYDLKHVKSTTAWALLFQGEEAGRVVANWSDNPAGSVCTATLSIWKGPLAYHSDGHLTASARGYGYDKLSQAVYYALKAGKFEPKTVRPGNGQTRQEFEAWGYQVVSVLG